MDTATALPHHSTALHLADIDHMASPDSSHFLKMEDLHTTSASPSSDTYDHPSISQSSPPPIVVESKPAKKRKSWGQELPEPKTSLPPRKRAKTDDEKEQRRIERIKRNRAAAHNSRERKRQETETLAVALARANAELDAYRKLHGPLPASIVLPEVHLCTEDPDDVTTTQTVTTPAPSLVDSHGSQADAASPASPADSIFHPTIKQESLDNAYQLPPAFDNLDPKSSLLSQMDQTQHSAAMLCDLPCRSTRLSSSRLSPSMTSWWSTLFLYLMASQFQTCYRTTLVALSTLSPSRMARLMQASAIRSTSPSTTSSTTLQLLRSTPRCLALCNAATGLSAPQKRAQALRLSRDELRRSREELTARQAQADHRTSVALTEHVTGGTEDQPMGDDGNENHGVGRSELT